MLTTDSIRLKRYSQYPKENRLSITITSDGFEVVVQTQFDGETSGIQSGAVNETISAPTADNTSRHYTDNTQSGKFVNPISMKNE